MHACNLEWCKVLLKHIETAGLDTKLWEQLVNEMKWRPSCATLPILLSSAPLSASPDLGLRPIGKALHGHQCQPGNFWDNIVLFQFLCTACRTFVFLL